MLRRTFNHRFEIALRICNWYTRNPPSFPALTTEVRSYNHQVPGTTINSPPAAITNLPPCLGVTFTITWPTPGLPPGTYQLKANASSVSGELYTTNNISPATTVSLSLNQPPTASFSLTPSSTYVGDLVSSDGSTSFDLTAPSPT